MALVNSLGCGPVPYINASGQMTQGIYPSQPAFSAYLSASAANFCGNVSLKTIVCDTALYNIDPAGNGSYDTGTGTYTAPADGIWLFSALATLADITIGDTAFLIVRAGGNDYYGPTLSPVAVKAGVSGSGRAALMVSVYVKLTEGQTAVLKISSLGEAADTQTLVGAAAPDIITYFQGYKVA